jgi:hypothetical protein
MEVQMKNDEIDPIDVQIGGDADTQGIAQTITYDDIQTVLISPAPVEERIATLEEMRGELHARASADRGGDMAALLDDVREALDTLKRE